MQIEIITLTNLLFCAMYSRPVLIYIIVDTIVYIEREGERGVYINIAINR